MKKYTERHAETTAELEALYKWICERKIETAEQLREENEPLYTELIRVIDELVREKYMRTDRVRGKLDSYHRLYSDSNLRTGGLRDGDISQQFMEKIARPIAKGPNKGSLWLNHLLALPFPEWEPYLQGALNKHVLDLFKARTEESLDRPADSGNGDSENRMTLMDTLTKLSPCEAAASVEDALMAAEEKKELIGLLTSASELVVFADKYYNNGRCQQGELCERLKKENDPVRSVVRALRILLPELSPAEFRAFCFQTVPRLNLAPLYKLLQKDTEAGKGILRHSGTELQKHLLEGSAYLRGWEAAYRKPKAASRS